MPVSVKRNACGCNEPFPPAGPDLFEDDQQAVGADDGGAGVLHLVVKGNLGEDERGEELSHHRCVHLLAVRRLIGLQREINVRCY